MAATDLSPNADNYYLGSGNVWWRPNISSTAAAVTAGDFVVGETYTITTVGTTDFEAIGASADTVGIQFVATGVGTGTGTATPKFGAWRHLGNVPEYLFESTVETKEHRSSMHATRMVDKSVITSQTGQATITLEEWTAPNLTMWLLGEQTGADASAVIDIGKVTKHEGQLAFVGTNETGPQWNIWLPNVSFRPNGSLNPLNDDWGAMQLIGSVAVSTETDSFGLAARDGANLSAANLPAWA